MVKDPFQHLCLGTQLSSETFVLEAVFRRGHRTVWQFRKHFHGGQPGKKEGSGEQLREQRPCVQSPTLVPLTGKTLGKLHSLFEPLSLQNGLYRVCSCCEN